MARLVLLAFVFVAVATGMGGCGSDAGDEANDRDSVASPREDRKQDLRTPPQEFVDACEKTARETTLPVVYCPPLIPAGPVETGYHGPFGRGDLDWYDINAQSPDLPGPYANRRKRQGRSYVPPGHWLVGAARPPSKRRSFIEDTEQAQRIGTKVVRGVPTTLYLVPEGAMALDSGHAIFYWELDGIAYTVSVHDHVNRPVARAVAEGLIGEMLHCPPPAIDGPDCRLAFSTRVP